MIGKLTGRFDGVADGGHAIIEVGGVGYAVRMSAGALSGLQAVVGNEVALFIHTAVREDAIDLYGFPTQGELSFFKMLCSVSGIGPKTALAILNVSDVMTLTRAISRGDAAALTKVFGIGKKSAERIVVELRDKMTFEISADQLAAPGGSDTEVLEALMALGYTASEARAALKDSGASSSPVGVSERVAAALKQLGSRV